MPRGVRLGDDAPGTERDVTWESETTGLTVRETIDRRIGGAFPYRMRVELRLIG